MPNLTSKLTKYTILEVKYLFFSPTAKYNLYFVKEIHTRDYFWRWFANLSQHGECLRQFLVKNRKFFFITFLRKSAIKVKRKVMETQLLILLQAKLSLSTYRLKILSHDFPILSYKWFSENLPFVEYLPFVVRIPVEFGTLDADILG